MPAGTYIFPFRFDIPPDSRLPPTFDRRASGWIQYLVESRICPAGIGFTETKRVPITLFPKLDVNQPQYNQPVVVSGSKEVGYFWQKDGTISTSLEVPRSAWVPGDKFEVSVSIFNDTNKTLTGYATGLREHVVYYSDITRKKSMNDKKDIPIESFRDPIPPMSTLSRRISVTIPPSIGPSFDPDVGRTLQRMYSIIFVVKLPGLHFDFPIYAPIVIGTVPYNGALQEPLFVAPSAPPLPTAPDLVPIGGNEPSAPVVDDPPVPDYLAMLHAQMSGVSKDVDVGGSGNTNPSSASTAESISANSAVPGVPPPSVPTVSPVPTKSSTVVGNSVATSSFGFSVIGDEENTDGGDGIPDDWVIVGK